MRPRGWVVRLVRSRVSALGWVLAVLAAVTACAGSHGTVAAGSAAPGPPTTLARCADPQHSAATSGGLPDITLACLGNGPAVDVAGIAGPAVLSLWASWCYPCRQEMPLLQQAAEAMGGKVRIVGVDTNDKASSAIAFAKNTVRASYEELSDPDGKLAIALHAPGLPFTVAIDRGGTLVWHKAGKLTSSDITQAVHAARTGG